MERQQRPADPQARVRHPVRRPGGRQHQAAAHDAARGEKAGKAADHDAARRKRAHQTAGRDAAHHGVTRPTKAQHAASRDPRILKARPKTGQQPEQERKCLQRAGLAVGAGNLLVHAAMCVGSMCCIM